MLNENLSIAQIKVRYPDLESGMHGPKVTTLTGPRIYKFAGSVRFAEPTPRGRPGGKRLGRLVPLAQQLRSPWWFDESAFHSLQRFLSLDPSNQGFIIRGQAAIHYGWSVIDRLITARVLQPFRVFQGPGRWQVERTAGGSSIVFQAPDDLLQTYVPNIGPLAGRTVPIDAQPGLEVVSDEAIPSGDEIDETIQAITGKTVVIPGNTRMH